MAVYNTYELSGLNRCRMRRNRNIHVDRAFDDHTVKRSTLAKMLIKKIFQGDISGAQAGKLIDDYFEEDTDYASVKTRKIFATEMKDCINRYFNSEKRTPIIPVPAQISIHKDIEVIVKPDLMFVTKDSIEVAVLKYSKPKLTQSGRKKDAAAMTSLELYSILCYARKVAENLNWKDKKKVSIVASIYYLRKSNDSVKNNVFDNNFFDPAGKNVISLIDNEYFIGTNNAIDQNFELQLEEFLKGDDANCSEDKCSSCEFYKICSYKQAPKAFIKEKKVKSLASLNLTKDQKEAINFKKGIARINAGAGAGKTLTVALRTVELLNSGVKPEEIVLLTFTNTGAEEMRERINIYNQEFGTGCDISEMKIQTFNAFQDAIVHKEWNKLGFTREPNLIDDVERSSIIVDILKDKDIPGIDFRNFYMNTKDVQGALIVARKIFNIMKTYNLGDDDEDIKEITKHLGMTGKFLPTSAISEMALLYDEYTYRLNDESLIEFADQEILVFQLLCREPDYFAKMGIKHVIVDEFQDSNEGQMDFIKMIIDTPSFESLMVVGDDSQAIFGFRDTSPKYIIDFYNILRKQGTDFFLLENHRSTPEIIEFANKLNDLNTCRVIKSLVATRPHGKKPIARGFHNVEQEYSYIVESIQKKIDAGTKPEDIAFIASKKTELMKMASKLSEAGIPSVLLNPEPYKENSKVLAAIDMMRFIENTSLTECEMNWLNCLCKNKLLKYSDDDIQKIFLTTKAEVEELKKLPEKEKMQSIYAMLDALDDNDEVYQKFCDKLKTKPTVKKIIQYCNDFLLYGAECAVKREHDYPGVVLTTAHSSKGLEWPIVYNSITGYDSPEIRRKTPLLEEKRRLLFVSSTRARDELYITAQYVAFGSKDDKTYNIFLTEAYDILGQSFQPQQITN